VYDGRHGCYFSFGEVASRIGVRIIEERGLSDEEKTIVPASVGGVAGGEKYAR